jgi:CBS domain-containing protein
MARGNSGSPVLAPTVRTRVLVREVMNSPVISAEPGETVKAISEKMSSSKAGSVVIMENDEPAGIVTDGDIVRKVVSKDLKGSSVRASDIMSSPLLMIESEREIIDAARTMKRYGVKRLGVAYKKKLAGIISISDIVAITPDLFEIISEKALIVTGRAVNEPSFLAGYCDMCNQWSDSLLEIDNKYLCIDCTSGKEEE